MRLHYLILIAIGVALSATPAPSQTAAPCENGFAIDPIDGTPYACEGIGLMNRVPLTDMGVPIDPGSGLPYRGNDIWGWTDLDTDRRYALVGNRSGTYFVDVTDPAVPLSLGGLPTETIATTWRDIKVYADHAFIVADGTDDHGMQVFDLARLRGLTHDPNRLFDADVVYHGESGHMTGSIHNIAIDEVSRFAFLLGTNDCNGGLHIVDIRTPTSPTFAGCFSDQGYTHDAHCLVYNGSDTDYLGHEICFAFNEDHVSIVDVTDKASPALISTVTYPNVGYTHQGWYDGYDLLYGDDEADELNGSVPSTRTLRFDVTDLDAPSLLDEFFHGTDATDHNLYTFWPLIFLSNNASGLRILQELEGPGRELSPIAFFDTYPENDDAGFEGAWSVFPFFGSPLFDNLGPLLVSDRSRGLFMIEPLDGVFTSSEAPALLEQSITVNPNPFSVSSSIRLTAPAPQVIHVAVFDTLGRLVTVLFSGEVSATLDLSFDGQRMAPGTYVVRVQGETFTETRVITKGW